MKRSLKAHRALEMSEANIVLAAAPHAGAGANGISLPASEKWGERAQAFSFIHPHI